MKMSAKISVKNTQLGIFIKKKTGSTQAVEILNCLEHCISYYEVNALETEYADSQVNHQLPRAYVPTGVQPSTFATSVFDNFDHNSETFLEISIHCTNGIIIEMKKQNPQLPMHINRQNTTPIIKQVFLDCEHLCTANCYRKVNSKCFQAGRDSIKR